MGTLIMTFCDRFVSCIPSLLNKSCTRIHQNVHIENPTTQETPPPPPQINSAVFDIEAQMLLNPNSSSSPETTLAFPTLILHDPSIINSPCQGDNSPMIPRAHAQETLAVGLSSSFSSSASSLSSSSSIEDARKAKPPWVHYTYTFNPRCCNSSTPHESPTPAQEISARMNQDSQKTLHPIIWIFQNQELGRHLLVLAIPMIIALGTLYNQKHVPFPILVSAMALSLGAALIWNGILLRKTWPKASNWIELLGVALMLLSFYRFVACYLPVALIWIPTLCWLLNMLPFAVAFFSRKRLLENGDPIVTST